MKKRIWLVLFLLLLANLSFAREYQLNEVFPPVEHLSKSVFLTMTPDMGVLEIYRYTKDGVDLYVMRNTSYAPLEMTVELDPSTINTTGDIPHLIRVPARGTIAAFKLWPQDRSSSWSYVYNIPSFRIGYASNVHTGDNNYHLPYLDGAAYPVLQTENGSFSHYGDNAYSIDFDMPEGTPIAAMRNGTVLFVKQDSNKGGSDRKTYENKGNYIWIIHDDGTLANYYHLRQNGAVVKTGDRVNAGDIIGYSGNTGFSTQPHLHVQLSLCKGLSGLEPIPIRFKGIDGMLVFGEKYTAAPVK